MGYPAGAGENDRAAQANAMMRKYGALSAGRIVHYHSGKPDPRQQEIGADPKGCRGAMIVRVWNPERADMSYGYVNLTVFTDWTNDHLAGQPGDRGLRWETSVDYWPEPAGGDRPNWRTWHWPQDCPFA